MELKKLNLKKEYYYERVKCPLFPVHYNVIMGQNIKTLQKEVEDYYQGLNLNLSTQVGYAARITHHEKGKVFVVMIDLSENREGTVDSTCIHESVHLISWFIMDHVGVEVDHENHEV